MPPSLHPLIAESLRAFAQRWRALAWARGLGALVVVGGVGFTTVALFDRWLVLRESSRWLLSLAAYAGTGLATWLVAGRHLMRPPSARGYAAMLEQAWPGLRHRLVAAVELAETADESRHDSPAFRELVQAEAAQRLKDVRMNDVLPRSLVARWLGAASVAGLVGLVLGQLPGFGFGRQFARALLPMADIERVARVKIQVIEPAADLRWLAQGDHQPVVIELAGAAAEAATLELVSGPAAVVHERVPMAAAGARRFTASVPVGTGDFSFRVRAGDALTRPITLATRPRPTVAMFEKSYEAPAYAQLPVRRVVEEHGNLTALEGTLVDLRLRVNQPVRAGELAIISAGRTNVLALTAPAPDVVHARVPVSSSGTYQVRLLAAETGFGNKFSPLFEIRAEPDLAPQVTLEQPRDEALVAPDQVLALTGTATDDLGLASVAQHFQVNTGLWAEVSLALANRTNTTLNRRWDLLPLGLAAGDRITTKLVAVDLKGTRVETPPVQLRVGAQPLDSQRARALAARQQVQEALEASARAAAEVRKVYSPEAAEKIRAGDELQRQQTAASAGTALADARRQLDRADQQVTAALREAPPGRATAELAALAAATSVARRESLPKAEADRAALARTPTKAPVAPEPPASASFNEAAKSAQRLADFTAQTAAAASPLLAADQADALTARLEALAQQQQQLQPLTEATPGTTNDWAQVARRQTSAVSEVARAEAELKDLKGRLPKPAADRAARTEDKLRGAQTDMKAALNQPAGPALAPASQQMRTSTERAASEVRALGRELALRADKARADLAKQAESSADQVGRLRRDAERLAAAEERLAEAQRRGTVDPRQLAQTGAERAQGEAQRRAVRDQLEDRARTEAVRRDADAGFAEQLRQAANAVESTRPASEGAAQNPAAPQRLGRVEQALRNLEAGRQMGELASAAEELARQERAGAQSPGGTTSRPRDWQWMERQSVAAQRDARSAGLGETAAKALSEAMRGPEGQQVGREMSERKNGSPGPASMAGPLEQVAQQLRQASGAAGQAQAEARGALGRMTPGSGAQSQGTSGIAGNAGGGGGGSDGGVPPAVAAEIGGDWGRLPPKLAQDLRDAARNGVSGDYRVSVEQYFRALAERAKR